MWSCHECSYLKITPFHRGSNQIVWEVFWKAEALKLWQGLKQAASCIKRCVMLTKQLLAMAKPWAAHHHLQNLDIVSAMVQHSNV